MGVQNQPEIAHNCHKCVIFFRFPKVPFLLPPPPLPPTTVPLHTRKLPLTKPNLSYGEGALIIFHEQGRESEEDILTTLVKNDYFLQILA